MSSKSRIGNEVAVETDEYAADAERFPVVDETPELRPSVELEVQATVDLNHPDARRFGLTLEAEERLAAREWEVERTRTRWDRRQDSDREARTRAVAERGSVERRCEFFERAGSVDRWADPSEPDPREQVTREELAAINQQTRRLAARLDGWSRAAISRRLAERVVRGADVTSAVVAVYEEFLTGPGQVIPIAAVGEVPRREVDIEGRVRTLWTPSNPAIQQVGLIEDDSGRTKFTTWVRSDQPLVREGEHVRFRSVAKSWYQGRVSVALTGWSSVEFTGQ